ncbi:D-alanyl-D-alanine carboxypeptidase family protein [Erythrobacter dokdonensis]|uniref:serine-type D-Ala-D-Ala carboxypeptidase n=1 Tax=Erythrobacter dokdonensis DSW-74 TaxID=1300349 RepID=A0A1A7BN53_9SPHN|nr:D-alanyl-D-alanine carboxypeptidase family protein [Erythrobacter dokdonensis]OBV12590.1 D-alanyl-D-alanine carboxypeptidase [Erythrobacter dokdonensis DSW-74]
MNSLMRFLSALLVLLSAMAMPVRAEARSALDIAAPPSAAQAPVALLVDITSGQVLHARNADRRFMPASVTKVMTLYHAFELIEAGRLDPAQVFAMSPAVAREWRRKGSTMFLDAGERVSVHDLLLGIANVSANDGAAVLAEGQAGSVSAWTMGMNEEARKLGMSGSHFGTPNGFPDEGRTFTTANDLVKLARALVTRHRDKFGYYIGRTGFDYKGIAQVNHDPLIGRVPGADGIKTGFTNESGFSYLGTAKRDGQRLVMVLAGVENGRLRAQLARSYIEWGFSAFDRRLLFAAGAVVGKARVQDGDARQVSLVARGLVAINLPKTAKAPLSATIHYEGPLRAPITAGQEVAVLEVTAPGVAPARIPLHAADAVGVAGPFDRIVNAIVGLFT